MLLLQLVSATALKISANHTSPDGINAQNITFSFSATTLTSGCRVSVSTHNALFYLPLLPFGYSFIIFTKLMMYFSSFTHQAQSTSLAFSSLLDDGLNYCILYKLLSGEGTESSS